MIKVLKSGSSGNCYIVKVQEEALIIECGIGINDILKGFKFDISKVKGCILSHSHGDHSKSVKKIIEKSIDVFTGKETIKELKISSHRIHSIESRKTFKIGGFTILPFEAQHDVQCMGYLIDHPSIGKILFATDTYYLKSKFQNVDHVLIECNYSEDVLPTLPPWRARTIKSHMSLETLKETLQTWNLEKTKDITLIHISGENGDSERFQKEIEEITGIKTYAAMPGLEIK
ncbi:MBL fold metallo-hydrolase [Clostridium botulinum]|nr:MBL fold metallo-hydrolase [Clostridium botulinum]